MKKLISVILCAALLCSVFAVAASAAGCGCGKDPIIFVEGFASRTLAIDANTENEKEVFPMATDLIVDTIKSNLDVIADLLLDGELSSENEKRFLGIADTLFGDMAMDENGLSVENIGPVWTYPQNAEQHKNGDRYTFYYDWRADPYISAVQLRDFVEYIKRLTGHDKVSIIGFSEGTVILATYLTLYGSDDLTSVVWQCGAYNGVTLVGQLFTGRLHMHASDIVAYIDEMTGSDTVGSWVTALTEVLLDAGIFEVITDDIVNTFFDQAVTDDVLRQLIINIFGRMPGLWSFVADEYYDEAKDFVFPTEQDKQTFAGLIERIDKYHYEIQLKVPEIMEAARLSTGKIGVISKYNVHMTAIVEDSDIQADGIIDLHTTSAGATCARFGQTLGDDYVQAVQDGHNHLSADGIIDASTCLYPDQTWFIKNCVHFNMCDYAEELCKFICLSDHQVDVFENASFPQFVNYSKLNETAEPLVAENSETKDPKKPADVYRWFKQLIELIKHTIQYVLDSLTSALD